MFQPLTLERFEQFVEAYTQNHSAIVATLDDHTKRLDKIDGRLDRIENILWDGQRVAELERRLIQLAETVGRPDLATPLTRPIGT